MRTGSPRLDEHAAAAPAAPQPLPARKTPYEPPALERLGPWEAFTLQQSIPIFP
ncbi:MAG TPA: hypothetical protein VMT77_10190 [Gemmatimonadales bacterium]|nr:hypothetical protein [Gemmatimonadales bacterium]